MLSSERLDTEVTVPMGEQRRHFSLSVTPVGREGERGRVYVFRDITPQKRRQRRLERQNERLDQFASVVSHDIRNPLNVAQGRLAVVREEIPEEHAGAMERSLDRIEGMVDDLLTLARAGQTVEETESVRPAAVAREAWDHTDAAGADLELSLPVGFSVEADRDRLLHVFENLFRNAVDHNDGPVTVRVGTPARETPTDGGHPAALFVEDDGEGIPEAQRETVFDHGYTTSDTGTGFGLSIVSDVVGAHGWEVEVTEGTDGGARFEITGVTPAE
jgi:signal transduction histidine kinase